MDDYICYFIQHLPAIALTVFLCAFAGRYIYLCHLDNKKPPK